MALDDMARVVAAVVTPANGALVAFHLLSEGVLAASEYDTHRVGGSVGWVVL